MPVRLRPIYYFVALLAMCSAALGQTTRVLYSFGNGPSDGITPNDGLVFDSVGNIYGTTQRDGTIGAGTVFELSPRAGGGWTETVLYQFCSVPGCADGAVPEGGLVFGHSGNLYGTTAIGGTFTGGECGSLGCGTLFELSPQGGSWILTVLWDFEGSLNGDGAAPSGELAWDAAGNIYGTTGGGGSKGLFGTVFELSPVIGGGWTEAILHAFCASGPPCSDGAHPANGLSASKSGGLSGTTPYGAFDNQWGVVYGLSPNPDGSWTERTLHRFAPQSGGQPYSGVSFDRQGNLYGTTSSGYGQAQCGGAWVITRQSDFKASHLLFDQSGANGCTPIGGLFLDPAHNAAFGTTSKGGSFDAGTIFEIKGDKIITLYNFCQQGGCADGANPTGSLTQYGKALYGTTSQGGAFNKGTVFEITP